MNLSTKIGLSTLVLVLVLTGCASSTAANDSTSEGSAAQTSSTAGANQTPNTQANVTGQDQTQAAADAEKHGDLYGAFKDYATAAIADTKNSGQTQQFNASVANAVRVLSNIELQTGAAPTSTLVNVPFSQPFTLQVRTKDSGKPLAAVAIQAEYNEYEPEGTFTAKELDDQTDTSGIVAFTIPTPNAAGPNQVKLSLEYAGLDEQFQQLTGAFANGSQALLKAMAEKRLQIDYTVQSKAVTFVTAVIIQDLDSRGLIIHGSDQGQTAVIQELTNLGFKIPTLPIGPAFLEHKEDYDILGQLKPIFGNRAQRFAFGSVKIASVAEKPDNVSLSLLGSIEVADVTTQKVIHSVNRTVSVTADKLAAAMKDGYAAMGKELAASLARELP